MVDVGSGQGLSIFATAGMVLLFRGLQKSENDGLGQEMLFPDGHGVRSEIVDFGSGQGLSVFATAGIVRLCRGLQKRENAALGQKMLFMDGH